MPRIGHKCYRFKVSEVCLITIVRLGRSVGRPPMLPCQKLRAQTLQGGPRGWQTGRRTHLEKVANELHHKTFLFIAPKRLNELSWNFLGTLCRCPKNMVSKKISKIRILIRIFPEKSGFGSGFAGFFLATFIRATGRVSTKILGPIGAAVSELLARPAADVMNKEPIIGSKIGTYFRPQTPCRTDWAKFFCMGLWRGRLCMRLVQNYCFKRLPTP